MDHPEERPSAGGLLYPRAVRSLPLLLDVDAAGFAWAAAVEVPADVARTGLLWYAAVAVLALAVLVAVALVGRHRR